MQRETLVRAVAHSIAFSLYDGDRLVGFGRVVTDTATYAYLTDVVVSSEYRRRGLGQWLVESMLAHPQLQGLRRIVSTAVVTALDTDKAARTPGSEARAGVRHRYSCPTRTRVTCPALGTTSSQSTDVRHNRAVVTHADSDGRCGGAAGSTVAGDTCTVAAYHTTGGARH